MKQIFKFCLMAILMIAVASSFKRDDPISDCGCNSPVMDTVSNRIGSFAYDTITSAYVIKENRPYYWINYYYVCSDIGKADSIYKKHGTGSINVNFNGEIKKMCPTSTSYIPESSHVRITLNQLNDATE